MAPPHVLIVGRCGPMPMRIWAARAGARTSVITTPAELRGLLGVEQHELVLVADAKAPIGDWVTLGRAAHQVRPVSAVVAFDDRWLPHAAAINDVLGLPGLGVDTVRAAHDKLRWRDRLRAAGLEDVPSAAVDGPRDIVHFGARHGYPVIVKPASGTGSLGVTRLDTVDGAGAAYDRACRHALAAADGVLVERYLTGRLLIANTFTENGEHVLVAISKDHFVPPRMIDVGFVVPVAIEPIEEKTVTEHVFACLSAIGVRNGPATTEVRMTGEGPRTIECQLRLDGGDTPRLLARTLGVDLGDIWARQLVGHPVLPRLRRQLDARRGSGLTNASWWAYPDVDGRLVAIDGLDDARATPGVVGLDVRVAPGDRVRRAGGADDLAVQVFAEHADPERALAAARGAAERISFTVNTAARPVEIV